MSPSTEYYGGESFNSTTICIQGLQFITVDKVVNNPNLKIIVCIWSKAGFLQMFYCLVIHFASYKIFYMKGGIVFVNTSTSRFNLDVREGHELLFFTFTNWKMCRELLVKKKKNSIQILYKLYTDSLDNQSKYFDRIYGSNIKF